MSTASLVARFWAIVGDRKVGANAVLKEAWDRALARWAQANPANMAVAVAYNDAHDLVAAANDRRAPGVAEAVATAAEHGRVAYEAARRRLPDELDLLVIELREEHGAEFPAVRLDGTTLLHVLPIDTDPHLAIDADNLVLVPSGADPVTQLLAKIGELRRQELAG